MGKIGQPIVRHYEDLKDQVERKFSDRESIVNSRRKIVIPRRYHMRPIDIEKKRQIFIEATSDVPADIKSRAGNIFFNPYKNRGAYYGSIQALYLLGANQYHRESDVINKMEEILSVLLDRKNRNSWDKFSKRPERRNKDTNEKAVSTKDMRGRVQHNMRVLQRLGGVHPYGYKLKQLGCCIDIKYISSSNDENKKYGWYYQLNTKFTDVNNVKPVYEGLKKRPASNSIKELST